MTHPNLPADQVPAEVTEQAFQLVWQPRGWELAPDAPDPKLAADPEPPAKSTTPTARRAKKEKIR
jgi:hypothetical protein